MNVDLLDQELAAALEAIPEIDIWANLALTRELSLQRSKAIAAILPPLSNVTSMDYKVPQIDAQAIPVRVYRPGNQTEELPVLLWIHGGGFCFGSMEGDDYWVRRMTDSVGCVVVSVDYRLAPEYPFPAPLNDCYAALLWVANNSKLLSVDRSRIGVGGISAGGGLAAALALMARDKVEVPVIFQALLCPMIDNTSTSDSSYSITDKRIWNRNSNLQGWMHYLARSDSSERQAFPASKYAAPTHASDLHGLPSAYIGVGSVDLFVDENRDYSERLNAAGVTSQLKVFNGGFHAFEFYVPDAQISCFARETHYAAIRNGLFY
ncbi:MAG: hypothetical protein ABS24_07560 [SAR92 bacterium BACL26 MAG-121220-bin70]|jgi:acetyl esterase/lipase|uniref:Alpha/beta hydrolase fold-3 domain-containing protein n=1 Tax=SAR92 bacterium BACL26 MAG-121220-bin70 TaxID=1655626 RepID=A0A0R2UB19_9GAMM|nr:MAG: hypothetical protein ABS24_07560 [SAR92 bacterium BACL26 MAG-121220-bin70]